MGLEIISFIVLDTDMFQIIGKGNGVAEEINLDSSNFLMSVFKVVSSVIAREMVTFSYVHTDFHYLPQA